MPTPPITARISAVKVIRSVTSSAGYSVRQSFHSDFATSTGLGRM